VSSVSLVLQNLVACQLSGNLVCQPATCCYITASPVSWPVS